MKNILYILGLAVLLGCSEKAPEAKQQAGTFEMTLSHYYNAKGTVTNPTWKAGEKAGLFIAEHEDGKAYYGNPMGSGSAKGTFLFALEDKGLGNVTAVGFYPSDLQVSCSGGALKLNLPVSQTGEVTPCMLGKTEGTVASFKKASMDLKSLYCTMYIHVRMGNYSVKGLKVKANGGEGLAGNVSLSTADWKLSADSPEINVNFNTPVDCSKAAQTLAVTVVPGRLSQGYTVTVTDTDGNTFDVADNQPVTLPEGGRYDSGEAGANNQTELYFCGDNMVYLINAELANENGYKDAILWSYDAKTASETIGVAASDCIRLDDCKPVDNGRKLLLTSSRAYCILLDVATSKILFWASKAVSGNAYNAHSAELLPNDRVVVACSDDGDQLQVYDIASPNKLVTSVELKSAHGAVWNEATQRLYAIGYTDLRIYKLTNWDTAKPSLSLERTIKTPTGGNHDLTLVNGNTLCLAGTKAYLYDIAANKFTELTRFGASHSLKSMNYNNETGEIWYTDATNPEGAFGWSTQTIRYVTDGNATSDNRTIRVPDLNMYKVRVKNWGK